MSAQSGRAPAVPVDCVLVGQQQVAGNGAGDGWFFFFSTCRVLTTASAFSGNRRKEDALHDEHLLLGIRPEGHKTVTVDWHQEEGGAKKKQNSLDLIDDG